MTSVLNLKAEERLGRKLSPYVRKKTELLEAQQNERALVCSVVKYTLGKDILQGRTGKQCSSTVLLP